MHFLDDRRHNEERHEQRKPEQHLIRRRVHGAQSLAQDSQYDDDSCKRGHHQDAAGKNVNAVISANI